jgi:hypothetical protein
MSRLRTGLTCPVGDPHTDALLTADSPSAIQSICGPVIGFLVRSWRLQIMPSVRPDPGGPTVALWAFQGASAAVGCPGSLSSGLCCGLQAPWVS